MIEGIRVSIVYHKLKHAAQTCQVTSDTIHHLCTRKSVNHTSGGSLGLESPTAQDTFQLCCMHEGTGRPDHACPSS